MNSSAKVLNVAVAPISWGVCAVPGWGTQLPYSRVFNEMRNLGVRATESGPAAFLPPDRGDARRLLDDADVSVVGTYVDLVVHKADDRRWVDALRSTVADIINLGGSVVVLAVLAADMEYRVTRTLRDDEWDVLLSSLDEAADIARASGVTLAVHHHLATLIESSADIDRVLAGCAVPLCIDTGHAIAAGVDPVALIQAAGDRIAHVHLKDARLSVVDRLTTGELDFLGAVDAGMFCALGDGDLPISTVLERLADASYGGWIVLEQDVMLHGEPDAVNPAAAVATSLKRLDDVKPSNCTLAFGPALLH